MVGSHLKFLKIQNLLILKTILSKSELELNKPQEWAEPAWSEYLGGLAAQKEDEKLLCEYS